MKKNFTSEAADVFITKHSSPTPTKAQPKKAETPKAAPGQRTERKQRTNDEQPTNPTRAARITFELTAEADRKLRYIAFAERAKIKNLLAEAIAAYIKQYEQKNGEIK